MANSRCVHRVDKAAASPLWPLCQTALPAVAHPSPATHHLAQQIPCTSYAMHFCSARPSRRSSSRSTAFYFSLFLSVSFFFSSLQLLLHALLLAFFFSLGPHHPHPHHAQPHHAQQLLAHPCTTTPCTTDAASPICEVRSRKVLNKLPNPQ